MASTPLGFHAVAHGGFLRRRNSPNAPNRRKPCYLLIIRSSQPNSSPSSHSRLPPVRRRPASLALLLLHCLSSSPNRAITGSPLDKFIKRKKLEPLEVYVPAVLLTEAQFKDLEDYLDVEQPKYDISRSLLRSGPAASLRINMRAVAQYAADDGKGKIASDAVDRCLRALEDLDSLLLRAARNDSSATIKSMKDKVNVALESLDSLLQTVPSSMLDKAKTIADSYRASFSAAIEDDKSEDLDPELKKLEEIL